MIRPVHVALVLAASVLVGCGSDSRPAPSSEPPVSDRRPQAPQPEPPGPATKAANTPGAQALQGGPQDAQINPKVDAHRSRPPTAEERRTYKRHLQAGRKRGDGKDWPAAIAEFESALRAIPGDARALSELGWAAYQAGDMERAQAANKQAVARTDDVKLKAASLYNLGRIAEDQNQPEQAMAWYRQSQELRPRDAVKARIDKLRVVVPARTVDRPVPPGALPPLRPGACAEPRDKIEYCRCAGEAPAKSAFGPGCEWSPTPFARLHLVTIYDGPAATHLAEHRHGVWHQVVEVARDDSRTDHDVAVSTLKDSGREILLLTMEYHYVDRIDGDSESGKNLFFCLPGQSANEATSCPLELPVESHSSQPVTEEDPENPEAGTSSWELGWGLKGGVVTVELLDRSGDAPNMFSHVGKRRLFDVVE